MNRGTISASLQSDGTLPVSKENWYMGLRIGEKVLLLPISECKLEFHQVQLPCMVLDPSEVSLLHLC